MFKLCREGTILRTYRPTIDRVKFGLIASDIDHGFYRKYHPGHDRMSRIFWSSVIDDGFVFVKEDPNAMAGILSYDTVPQRLSECSDGMSDISGLISGSDLRYPHIETRFCYIYETLSFWRDSADRIHPRRIPKVSIYDGSHVDIEDITVFQDLIFSRNPMTDDVIERDTVVSRIPSFSPFIISEIVDTCRVTASPDHDLIGDLVELES